MTIAIETAALERVLARDTRTATEDILAQVMAATEASVAVLFVDRAGELKLRGGVGVDQECLDRAAEAWATSAAELREGRPRWAGSWCLWPCPTARGLAVVYLAGETLRLPQVRQTVTGIERLLGLLVGDLTVSRGDAAAVGTAVDLFLRETSVEEVERRQLTNLLHESEWNIALAARTRGVTRVTMYHWMQRLGIERLKVRRGLKLLRSARWEKGVGE